METIPLAALTNQAGLSIVLLGEPRIMIKGEEPIHFQYRKSIALLAFLATTQKAYSREYLAGFLWGKSSEKNAQAGLRKVLAEINAHLINALKIENRNILLNTDMDISIDVQAFEQNLLPIRQKTVELVTKAEIERLEYAISYYEEDFMNGFYVQNAPDFENWLATQREHLKVMMIEALQLVSNYTYRVGEFQKSMDYTRRLLVIEPALEEAHFKLISLLALSGQRTLAINQYHICKDLLAKTYGSLPQRETTELYKRIRSEPENQFQSRALPVPTMPILGRDAEIEEICSRLKKDECRILTITGPGGVGKTHLALNVGKQLTRGSGKYFSDGAVFVPLQALNSIHSLSSSIAYQLGYSYDKESEPIQQLCDFLSTSNVLLILDNFEQLIPSLHDSSGERYDFLNRILESADGVKLLITSRIRLNFQSEYVYPLQGISFPESEEENLLDMEYPAISLFLRRAEQLIGPYQPNQNDLKYIVDICKHVNGLPLGILLAAGWIKTLTLKEIAENLCGTDANSSIQFLAMGGDDLPERHRDMDAVFQQSWQMLSGRQQKSLAGLSVLRSSFTLEAAQQVAQVDLSDLRVLIDHSLVERNISGRFQVHELLRDYIGLQSMDLSEVRKRNCEYFMKKVTQWEKDIKGKYQVQAIEEMNLEIDNLRALWNRAIEMKNTICLTSVFEGFCLFYNWRHYYIEGIELCKALSEALRNGYLISDSFSKQDNLRLLSRVLTWQSVFTQSKDSEALLRESLQVLDDPLLVDEDIRYERAYALYMLAVYVSQTGHHGEALQLYHESIGLIEDIGDDWHLHQVLTSFGALLWDLSEYELAREVLQRSLKIARRIEDKRGIAFAMIWLGNIYIYLGDLDGEKIIRESLELMSDLGDEMGGVKGRNQACSSLFILGKYEEACDLMLSGRDEDQIDYRKDVTQTIYAVGLIHTGAFERALEHADAGLTFARELQDDFGLCLAIMTKGWMLIINKQYNEAFILLQEGSEHARRKGLKELFCWITANLALTEIMIGKLHESREHFVQALETAIEANGYGAKCFTMAMVPVWMKANGKKDVAISIYAFIWQYPLIGNSVWYRQMYEEEIIPLMASYADDDLEKIKNRFSGCSLEKVVAFVLDEMKG